MKKLQKEQSKQKIQISLNKFKNKTANKESPDSERTLLEKKPLLSAFFNFLGQSLELLFNLVQIDFR